MHSTSIGIIGGADGPTSIFVAHGGGMNLVVLTVLAVAIGLIAGILWNRKHK